MTNEILIPETPTTLAAVRPRILAFICHSSLVIWVSTVVIWFLAVVIWFLAVGCATDRGSTSSVRADRTKALFGTRATYCSLPRKADGRMDADKLLNELVAVQANTYSFCIHSA